jgi:membrane protein
MSMFKKKQHDVPQLNTASLPDLIFSVLFFFMIVTHMRTDNSKVRYSLPKGMSLANLQEKKALCSISIGKLLTPNVPPNEQPTVIEVNGKPVAKEQLTEAIKEARKQLKQGDKSLFTVLIKADERTPMHEIMFIKKALQEAKVDNVFYVGQSMRRQ